MKTPLKIISYEEAIDRGWANPPRVQKSGSAGIAYELIAFGEQGKEHAHTVKIRNSKTREEAFIIKDEKKVKFKGFKK